VAFKLRFPRSDVTKWAKKYAYTSGDSKPLAVAPAAKTRGHLTKGEFIALTTWKTPRTQKRRKSNSADFIRTVTEVSLATKDERLRIEILTLLSGVQLPTASVILHFCAQEPYPILDFFALWWAYCQFTRGLTDDLHVSMRVLDRALWQFSKEKQPAGT
jgi:hypothetical protein